jgi:polysaccharide biosynthesis transport protein
VGGEIADGGRVNSAADMSTNRPATVADYLAILRRRVWIVIMLPVLTALTAYALSTTQSASYRARAQVRFDVSNAATQIAGIPSPSVGDPTYLPTQAAIARERGLADRVVAEPDVPAITADRFLAESSATPRTDVNIIDLFVTDPSQADAVALVNAYAREFKSYRTELATATIRKQVQKYARTIRSLRARGNTGAVDALLEKMLDLETEGNLLANNAQVSQFAEGATKIRPLPRRNALVGALLGALLGIGVALLAEALDRRVRSEHDIEKALGLPLLGRIPAPGRRLRRANKLVMLAAPQSVHAETFRKLRTSLEFVNVDRGARTIMMTSAGPQEGKSTTIANLAVAFARAGRQVALVDLDLRRPFLHCFFKVSGDHGMTDVVVDRIDLEQALRPVAVPSSSDLRIGRGRNGRRSAAVTPSSSNGYANAEGVLHLLPCGTVPPAADEFLESKGISLVLEELSRSFDVVLVDAPPLLAVGDAQTLSAKVDAMVVVTRLGIHRRQLQELARQLQNCRAAILGFVLTGVSHGDSYSYGYGYDPHVYDVRQETRRRGERV